MSAALRKDITERLREAASQVHESERAAFEDAAETIEALRDALASADNNYELALGYADMLLSMARERGDVAGELEWALRIRRMQSYRADVQRALLA